jgi:hypothetical protein
MKLLVCGGRDYTDRDAAFHVLDEAHSEFKVTLVIHGAARGADRLAGEWARARSIPVQEFPANWTQHDKAAGYIRNEQMLREGRPQLVLALPGGRGTAHMVQIAKKAGVPVRQFVLVT